MPDDPSQPTGLPTSDPSQVSSIPAPGIGAPVNPAQAPTSQYTSPADVSAIVASYEARISRLMSEKDRANNDRAAALTQLAETQRQLADLQASTSASLTATTDAAQTALTEVATLRQRNGMLEGELARANALLQKPHLADYAQFIPTNGDAAQINAAIEQLEQIRNKDLERARGIPTLPQLPGQPTLPGQSPPPIQSLATQLYGNRPNMPPVIGSNPAQMHPAGAQSTAESINAMLAEARNSGDPAKFEAAVQQASLLAQQAVNAQLGRS